MTREPKRNQGEVPESAQPAEFPDDADILMDVDHDPDKAFVVRNGDPNFHYFLAADDGDRDRPDGVFQCKQMGYVECTDEQTMGGGGGCKLLKLPKRVFEARRARKRNIREAAEKARREKQATIGGIPQSATVNVDRPDYLPDMVRVGRREE